MPSRRLTLASVVDRTVAAEVITTAGSTTGPRRAIGGWGTTARLLAGGYMVGSVVVGSVTGTFRVESYVLGVVVFPAVALSWQAWRARRRSQRLVAVTGPLGHLFTLALLLFLVLYGTAWVRPVDRVRQRRGTAVLGLADVARRHPRLRRLRGAGHLELAPSV